MPKSRRRRAPVASFDEILLKRKNIPHEFVLDALSELDPWTRPMFGCLAVYVEEKIVLALRDRPNCTDDNGVWIATTVEHHKTLKKELPSMRSIGVLGKDVTGWQILPATTPDFEESALHVCELILDGDPRIGKIPKSKKRRK
ncbi:MAG TPA: hypothetical protein VN684_00835 [Terriglobales bacterium]|nr:hypothetical protein [Terriglobales bacterium]